eukprot:COSAG01_NODE_11792_length_1858_cov_1.289369_1_plen_69_part_10
MMCHACLCARPTHCRHDDDEGAAVRGVARQGTEAAVTFSSAYGAACTLAVPRVRWTGVSLRNVCSCEAI